jgi:hypothetical protein
MKKAATLVFVIMFAACLFHFYYAEDHCPIHCLSRGARLGHVQPHHAGPSVCLCFWTSLLGPEVNDFVATSAFLADLALPSGGRLSGMLAADITPPPRSFLV